MEIIHHKKPELKMPEFSVDGILHKKLDEYEITKLLNRHTFTMYLGRAGSGKSSLMTSLLQTPELFKKVYTHIHYICPPNSRASMKNNVFEKELPPDKIYDDLKTGTLEGIYSRCMAAAELSENNLIIIDDCQAQLKNADVQKQLLHIVSNRRHARTSIWLLAQNYLLTPKQIRMALGSIFAFKVSKPEMVNLFEEVFENKDKFEAIVKLAWKKSHDFVFIDTGSQRIFLNWSEVIFSCDNI
jgi:hypothetical protein